MPKSVLKDMLSNSVEHFIAKYYVKAKMDYDSFLTKYEVYYKANGKGRWNPTCETYQGLQYIELNKEDIRLLHDNVGRLYKIEVSNKHGVIYTSKELGFRKEGIKRNNKYTLEQLKLF
jgi:hypothetical protein